MKKERYYYLDTIRFLAVLLITFAHFDYQIFSKISGICITEKYFAPPAIASYLFFGYTGKYALVFMCIISGFVLTKKMEQNKESIGSFVKYRYIRLMLPIACASLFFYIYKELTGNPTGFIPFLKGALLPGNPSLNDQLWCIKDFLIGNCIIFMVEKHTKLLSNKYLIYGICNVIFYAISYFYEAYWLIAILLGAMIYHICNTFSKSDYMYNPIMILLLIPAWFLPRGKETVAMYYRGMAAVACIILAIYGSKKLQAVFHRTVLIKLNKISYELFIVHGFTMQILGEPIVHFYEKSISNPILLFIYSYFTKLLLDMILAVIVYKCSEKKLYPQIKKIIDKNKIINWDKKRSYK